MNAAAAIDRVVHHSLTIEFGRDIRSVRAEEAARPNRVPSDAPNVVQHAEG
jgi:hypothetical protein